MSDRQTGRTTRMVFEVLACNKPDIHIVAKTREEADRILCLLKSAAESVGWTVQRGRFRDLLFHGRRVTCSQCYGDARGRRCPVFFDHGKCL